MEMHRLLYLFLLLYLSGNLTGVTTLTSNGGKIGIVQQARKVQFTSLSDGARFPLSDENSPLGIAYEGPLYSRLFSGSENYTFTDGNLTLEPIPDEGHFFTYWIVDGVPMMGERGGARTPITNENDFVYGGSNSIFFDLNESLPASIQAVFSPSSKGLPSEVLSPIGEPTINLTANPTLKETRLISEGGTIAWEEGTGRWIKFDERFMPLRDANGELVFTNPFYAKQFRGEEDFVFTNSGVTLEPIPDEGNTFTYWLIDGKPLIGDRLPPSFFVTPWGTENALKGFNSITIEENATLPSSIQAVFSPVYRQEKSQDLSPLGNPTIDLVQNPSLKKTLIISENGSVGWVQRGRSALYNEDGWAKFDINGELITSPSRYAKEFIGSEEFIFPSPEVPVSSYYESLLNDIILEPIPDKGYRFDHWKIDLKPVIGNLGLLVFSSRARDDVVVDSIIFDENDTIPTIVEAIFVKELDNTWTDINGTKVVGTLLSFNGITLKISQEGVHKVFDLKNFDTGSQSAIIQQGLGLIQKWVDINGIEVWAYFDDLNGSTLSLSFYDEKYSFELSELSKASSDLAVNLKIASSRRSGIELGQSHCTPYTNSWFYIPNRGWMWSSNSAFPWFYQASTKNWFYFRSGGIKPLFFDNSDKRWMHLE